MKPGRIVIDGLWRCLCPSVDAAAFYQTLRRPAVSRRQPTAITSRSASTAAVETQPQLNATTTSPAIQWPHHGRQAERHSARVWKHISKRAPPHTKTAAKVSDKRYVHRKWKRHPTLPRSFFTDQGSSDEELHGASTDAIVEGLRELCESQGQYHGICNTVRYLVTNRNKKADVFLYNCLIQANCDPEFGSAEAVGDMLEEMESTRVLPTAATYQSVLEVLAVHPDYVLRNRAIDKMEAIWKPPTINGRVAITVGLIRDGQYEMALESLEYLYKNGAPIPHWLYDIFIYTFGALGAHEETLMILQQKERCIDAPPTHNLWHYLLDVFSKDSFYEGTRTVWNRMVMQGKAVASDGTAVNVLNLASRHNDANMATQVIQQLLDRGVKLGMHHFEPLLEIQSADQEIQQALSTICLMSKAGHVPDRSSTRSVVAQLQSTPKLAEEAVGLLHDLKKSMQVPIAAFNVVLEATLLTRGFPAGLDLYRSIGRICSVKPSLETYNLLLQHCDVPKFMRFLVAEMEAFSIAPDEAAFDRMIFISTSNTNYEPAFRYLEQMVSNKTDEESSGWWISRPTALSLLRRAISAKDNRTQGLMEECEKRGIIDQADIEVLMNTMSQGDQSQGLAPATHENVQIEAAQISSKETAEAS
ncbi:hypothetical protein PFICI_05133 [Pestalotiopsis fici W106-1]|uniref:Pentatricopeptide repeat-containing protein-mitochondrial domain-containing protein n=1 Tax=Pestalotiopsis fici (strain W106-1 / CGMCC3.15140) TaxID=1229662 RepID=W3XCX4_PESFW|nr:uncharacterized protein PFICI_05133 [Pestalotiopsis fici W106-1]ETS83257.1 hypothetical protein PFICI_05133 [Pestalotiopsis fici W106-1]